MLMLHRLESEKTRAASMAQAEAQSQVQDEVSRILSVERAVAKESIQHAVIRERIATEDERHRAQLLVSRRVAAAVNITTSFLSCFTHLNTQLNKPAPRHQTDTEHCILVV